MQVDCTERIVGGLGILLERLLSYRKEYEKRRSDHLAAAGRLMAQIEKLDSEVACVSLLVEAWRDREKPNGQKQEDKPVEAAAVEATPKPAEAEAAPKTTSKRKGK